MKLVYYGEKYYRESNTEMSSIYTEDGHRTDFGFMQIALENGEEVHIRQASNEEIIAAETKLVKIKRRYA